jgi:hypothetical protein
LPADIPASETAAFTQAISWTPAASMTVARRGAGAAILGPQGVVAGGFDTGGNPLSSVERYDSTADSWTLLAPMPTARGGLGVARIGNKMFAAGGDTGAGSKTAVLEVLDLPTWTWDAGPFAPMATARSHFGCAAFEGFLYVFGGEGTGGSFLGSVERYDPVSDAWTSMGSLPRGLKGALCLYDSGNLKLFGGELQHATASDVMTDQVLVYDAIEDSWRVEDSPLPYAARDLFGCAFRTVRQHRGNPERDEFCLLGGGFDGTNYRDGFFRFYTR